MLDTSVLASDGVSCLACHMQSTEFTGSTFSGVLHSIVRMCTARITIINKPEHHAILRGVHTSFGEHIVNSEVCAGCHS